MRLTVAVLAALLAPAASALADVSDSTNWAGYAVHRDGVNFRTISSFWVQPSAACIPGTPTYSAIWVGLGGYSLSSNALEQIGTEVDCTAAGRVSSSSWYELVPAASITISLKVHPGDVMGAAVSVKGHRATLALDDFTTRRKFVRSFNAPQIDVSAAEWIVEAPSECGDTNSCDTLPLAPFTPVAFSGASVTTTKGQQGTISDPGWDATSINLRPDGTGLPGIKRGTNLLGGAAASTLSPDGSAFSVSYLSAASPQLVGSVRGAAADRAAGRPPGVRR